MFYYFLRCRTKFTYFLMITIQLLMHFLCFFFYLFFKHMSRHNHFRNISLDFFSKILVLNSFLFFFVFGLTRKRFACHIERCNCDLSIETVSKNLQTINKSFCHYNHSFTTLLLFYLFRKL